MGEGCHLAILVNMDMFALSVVWPMVAWPMVQPTNTKGEDEEKRKRIRVTHLWLRRGVCV